LSSKTDDDDDKDEYDVSNNNDDDGDQTGSDDTVLDMFVGMHDVTSNFLLR